jgi:hypothetical protein
MKLTSASWLRPVCGGFHKLIRFNCAPFFAPCRRYRVLTHAGVRPTLSLLDVLPCIHVIRIYLLWGTFWIYLQIWQFHTNINATGAKVQHSTYKDYILSLSCLRNAHGFQNSFRVRLRNKIMHETGRCHQNPIVTATEQGELMHNNHKRVELDGGCGLRPFKWLSCQRGRRVKS